MGVLSVDTEASRKAPSSGSASRVVMARMAAVWLACLLAVAVDAAQCQTREVSKPGPLPDAPSLQIQPKAFAESAPFHFMFGASEIPHETSRAAAFYAFSAEDTQRPSASHDPFARFFRRSIDYHSSPSNTLMGRATYAATRTLLRHDDSGKVRLNTSYLLTVLTTAAAHTAYRPYWKRNASQPFADVGSTIGNDAGLNVLHEFEPGIRELLKNHEPKFVSRIEGRINRK